MEKIKIRVLDYYNRPAWYPHMSNDLFNTLEQAFLDDKEFVEVQKILFDSMIESMYNPQNN